MCEISTQTNDNASTSMVGQLEQLNLAKGIDVARAINGIGMVLKKMDDLKPERIAYPEKSTEVKDLYRAISTAKRAGLNQMVISGKGQRHEYASWEDLLAAFSAPLDENGLGIDFFMTERNGEYLFVGSIVHFETGQWRESVCKLNEEPSAAGMSPDQALGSSLTYRKRYTYSLLLGI